jgi:integrase
VSANPVSLVDLPVVPHSSEIRYLTPAEVHQLVGAVGNGPYAEIDRTLFFTAAMTGLRLGELRALRWRDVDRPSARVRVRRNYVRGEFGTPKTRRAERSVPLAATVADALDRLFDASARRGANDLVFADPLAGGPLNDNAIRDRLRSTLRAAGLDVAHRFHDLRHTFGTAMAAAGMPMRTLQELMGHRDLATTQRYADYAPSHQEAAFVDTAFGSQGPVQGPNSSEPQQTSEHEQPGATGDPT